MMSTANIVVAAAPSGQSENESIKNLVIASIQKLNKLRQERRTARTMLGEMLIADPAWKQAEEEVRKAKIQLEKNDQRMAHDKNINELKTKIRDINREYNETRGAVSDYLIHYEEKTHQLSFLDLNGDKIQIIKSAKHKLIPTKYEGKKRKGRAA